MKGRPATQAGLPSSETPAVGPVGPAAAGSHHPQGGNNGYSHHPQGVPVGHPHYPQAGDGGASAEPRCPASAQGCAGEAGPDVRQPGCVTPGCTRRAQVVAVPSLGVLRPMARALLSVAAEVQAIRCDPLGAGGQTGPGGLRMGNQGLREGVHYPVRSGVRSPATLERTGSGVASSHVRCPAPPPVVNPDSMGDCA